MFQRIGQKVDNRVQGLFQNSLKEESPGEDLSNFAEENLEDKMEDLLN